MAKTKIFVGTYHEHGSNIAVQIRRTCVARRHYTHAVIPYYTSQKVSVPAPNHPGLTIRVDQACEPWHGKAQFCGSLASAQKKLKPGWILVEVQELQR
jgi:hypothetical protein